MAKWTGQGRGGREQSAADLTAALDRFAAEQRTRQERKRQGGVIYRSRRQLAPWVAAIALVSAAALGHVLGISSVVTTGSWISLAGGAVLALRRMPPHWRVRAVAAMAASAAWLPWAVEALTWSKLAVLLPGFYALKARHDRTVRIPTPTTRPAIGKDTPTTTMEMWEASVGAPGFALPGSYLEHPRVEDRGVAVTETHDGQFVPGKQDLVMAQAAVRQIASGLRRPVEDLVLDEHPSRDPSRFLLKTIRRGPAQAPVMYAGPRWRDGRVLLGPHSDGDGDATYVVYIAKRIRSGMVIGQTGSGKSRIIEVVCLGARAQGHTTIVFVDGQDGMSSPTLMDEAWASCGTDGMLTYLAALEAVQKHRMRVMTERRLTGFSPSPEFPGILVPMDEVHRVFYDTDIATRWALLAREAGKVGIGMLCGDQDGSLGTFRVNVLRASLQAGNTIGLRTADREQGAILDGNGFNLRDLPDIPGFAQVLNTSGDVRAAPFRAEWLPDQEDVELHRVPVDTPTVDDWYRKIPGVPLDEGSARAWDSAVSGAGTAEPMPATAGSSDATVLPFPVKFVFSDQTPAPAQADRRRGRDLVLDALRAGHCVHGAVVTTTGLSDRQVRNVLGALVEDGTIRKIGKKGRYALLASEGEPAAS